MAISIYDKMTPLKLLNTQQICADIIANPKSTPMQVEQALELRDTVNLELITRGRCTCCGMRHNIMECHRVRGKSLEDIDVP